ncbi:unnamed protein product [Adineta steineri]|uniref:Uncharacterized protein n=1 Tax=Adineta steineri TaxID=433720 RepID=A0A819TAR2_9BILA|nr:unnamed protein product [Adineta steineri]
MKTVYAITYYANKHRLHAVSGKNGKNRAVGFTFNAHPESFGDLIATWEPNEHVWKLLFKQIEEKSSLQQQQYDNNILQLYQGINMTYLIAYQEHLIIAKYPQTYLLF